MTRDELQSTLADIEKKVPTNDELIDIINKIADFLKKFFEIFDKLKEGLEPDFAGYKSVF